MIYFPFENATEFTNMFKRADGTRKNGVLLAFYKHMFPVYVKLAGGIYTRSKFLQEFDLEPSVLEVASMHDLTIAMRNTIAHQWGDGNGVSLSKWQIECGDEIVDARILYDVEKIEIIFSNGKAYPFKFGKAFDLLTKTNSTFCAFPLSVRRFVQEQFCSDMKTWCIEHRPHDLQLVVSSDEDDFEKIYSSEYLANNMNSCMIDNDCYSFYYSYVNAKAAYLWDEENETIMARCIIFTEVHHAGGTLRLAERQYATNSCTWANREQLQTMLINKLIEGDYIDGYKEIGAGCSENNAFVLNDGTSFNEYCWIRCYLGDDEREYTQIPYMDSFVYYNGENLYNFEICNDNLIAEFNVTSGSPEFRGHNYDSYSHNWTDEDVFPCWKDGIELTATEDELEEDFVYLESLDEYHYHTECDYCKHCGEWFLVENLFELSDDFGNHENVCQDCLNKQDTAYDKVYDCYFLKEDCNSEYHVPTCNDRAHDLIYHVPENVLDDECTKIDEVYYPDRYCCSGKLKPEYA